MASNYIVGRHLDPQKTDPTFQGPRALELARDHAKEKSARGGCCGVYTDRFRLVVLYVDQVPFVKEK